MDYEILMETAKREGLAYKYKEAASYVGMIQEVLTMLHPIIHNLLISNIACACT